MRLRAVPGCQLAASDPERTAKLYEFLRERSGEDLGLWLGCCGAPALWAGRMGAFDQKRRAMEERWREAIMRGMGVTKEDREAALAAIQAGVLDGTMTDAELNAYYKSGAITGAELERFKKIDTQVSREQKDFISNQRKALSTDMDGLKIPGKDDKLYRNIALNKFNELVSQLDPNSKTYRMEIGRAHV